MAELTADQALKKARTLLKAAGQPGSTVEERRALVETLITLPSYRDPTCTLLFSSLITRYFKDFEDLQDGTVDAVLDLCEDEDEATRITGIKGLGSTAKADARWVRGNAGVLLQLLECPERELKEVKIVLDALMDMSPHHVIEVMADDCKGSEEETGASRRNIIEYLSKDCGVFRRKHLESGNSPATEDIFRTGFMDVLKTASASEAIMILEMLVPLPSISGPIAKKEITTSFVRALTDSLKGGSSPGRSTRHIQIFGNLAERQPKLDPRAALYFFSKHGAAVIAAMMLKEDPVALGLIKRLRGWVQEAVKQWEKEALSDSDKKVVKHCLGDMLEEITAIFKEDEKDRDRKDFLDHAPSIEIALLPLYELIRYYDIRRDGLSAGTMDSLEDLANYAVKLKKELVSGTTESKRLRNIADMCDIIMDPKESFEVIVPSWTSAAPAPPPQSNIPNAGLARPNPVVAPSGPRSSYAPRSIAPTQPHASSSRPTPYPATKPPPSAPAGPRQIPHPPSGPSSSRPPLNSSSSQTRGLSVVGTAPSAPVNGRPTAAAMNSRDSAIDLTTETSVPRVLPVLANKMSSRGKELLSQAKASSPEPTIPLAPPPPRGNGLPIRPSLESRTSTPSIPVPISTPPIPNSTSSTAPPSLLSRISGLKRDRDDPSPTAEHPPPSNTNSISSKSSLASRLGGISHKSETEETESKRPKTMSILSARISKGSENNPSSLPSRPSILTSTSPPPSSMSVNGHSNSSRNSLLSRIQHDPLPIDKIESSQFSSNGGSTHPSTGIAIRKEIQIKKEAPKEPISIFGRAQSKAEAEEAEKAEEDKRKEEEDANTVKRGRGFGPQDNGGGSTTGGPGRLGISGQNGSRSSISQDRPPLSREPSATSAPPRERNHSGPKPPRFSTNAQLIGAHMPKPLKVDREKHQGRTERAG